MFSDWEDGLVGNNFATVSRLPRRISLGRVVINFVRPRRARHAVAESLTSAA